MKPEWNIEKEKVIGRISRLWYPLTAEQTECLRKDLLLRYFKKNESIFKEKEKPSDVLCLVEGKVKIYKNGIDGRNAIIRVIKPIEFMGYRALVAKEHYRTSAVALDNSVIAVIPDRIIRKLVRESTNVAMFFIRHLATLLGTSDERIINHTQKHIRGRLADTLISLKEKYGVEHDGMTLGVNISREDLAGMSNMTTSNAIRTLSSFANEGIISIQRKKIIINDEEELKNISTCG